MEQTDRLEAFEKMLAEIQNNCRNTMEKMEALKAAGKEKSATYRQLFSDKMRYQDMLAMYRLYGLVDSESVKRPGG